ncbi:toxin-antitoxin system toxin subunit [Actinomyces sp. B33]|uniref:nucleotidyltransferase domain-containing protein n=1 Tax=Actinomyces sp. B33 TaxID=2942131 RepID=UPI00234008D4|nr:nucleotidyltransferase domain-containing protein [Actinomyces sp. B33]MDC4233169.1 toxin-antitoxin system toxin subunit [Actinomyces sp. B33]
MEETLSEIAERCDRAVVDARAELVAAIRRSRRQGLTQEQIATATGRSQPEIHRLLRFHGMTPLGKRVARHRGRIESTVASLGGSDPRIFGSVATGRDDSDSDVDILYSAGSAVSMLALARAQEELSKAIGTPVEIIAESDLAPWAKRRILEEAVPL